LATITESTNASPEQQLRPYLRAQERLLWSGRPDPDVVFSSRDIFLIPFSLMWGGFALFWEGAVIVGGTNAFFILWGIPFVLIGLYMIFGRFIAKKRWRRRAAYGVTDQRALVAVGTRSVSDSPVKNTATSVRRSRDGKHVTVSFGSQSSWALPHAANADLLPWFNPTNEVAFVDVAEPEGLLQALERARSA
jgi:hypothetical protein